MKRISRYGLMLMAIAALSAAPSAWAACTLDTQLVGHTLGGTIINCPDANPIEGYIWLLANSATANSNGQNLVCRHEGEVTDSGVDCTFAPGAGIDGDGIITIYYEFGVQNAGSVGCPNPTATGTAGTTPIGVQITCNNGATALFTLGFDPEGSQQYSIDLASPADAGGNVVPFSASIPNNLQITSVGAGPSPSASNVCVHVNPPAINSDCDPTSLSGMNAFITCPDQGATRPAPGRGILMTRNGPCNGNPDLRASGWTATVPALDAAGDACVVVNPAAGECAYLGVQGLFGAANAGGIISYAQVGGPGASSDKVKIDSATTAQGKVKIDFSTTNEQTIVGFNVYSDGAKLNSSLIASKGVGNNAYAFEIGRGALKGGKSVLVEAVKKDGTVEKTAPVSLK